MNIDPKLIRLATALGPELIRGVKESIDIYERLQNGDESAVNQAKDWLGVTDKVQAAIENWEASKAG